MRLRGRGWLRGTWIIFMNGNWAEKKFFAVPDVGVDGRDANVGDINARMRRLVSPFNLFRSNGARHRRRVFDTRRAFVCARGVNEVTIIIVWIYVQHPDRWILEKFARIFPCFELSWVYFKQKVVEILDIQVYKWVIHSHFVNFID